MSVSTELTVYREYSDCQNRTSSKSTAAKSEKQVTVPRFGWQKGKAILMKEFWIKGTTIYLVPKQCRWQCGGGRGRCASYMELTRLPIQKGKGSLGDFPALHDLVWLSFPTPVTSDFPHLNSRSRGHHVKGLSRVQAYYKLSGSLWLCMQEGLLVSDRHYGASNR